MVGAWYYGVPLSAWLCDWLHCAHRADVDRSDDIIDLLEEMAARLQ